MASAPKQIPVTAVLAFLLLHSAAAPSWCVTAAQSVVHEIRRGFSASHDSTYSKFQPLLADPTGVFFLGFLRVDSSQLDLAVLHLPSSSALWRAALASPVPWSSPVSLSFNGSLVLSISGTGLRIWSTATDAGDRLVLLNSSNLQVQKQAANVVTVLWQSFDFPADTLVQDQNFTSAATLISRDRRFMMKLGAYFLALYMELGGDSPAVMYWKHTATETKAQIVDGKGPIYARVDSNGYLGMYQTEATPVDLLPFDSFSRGIPGLRRLTLETDGNLRAYYWNGSTWVRDLQAISHRCEIPTACGAYGLCSAEDGRCSCLEGGVEDGCLPGAYGNLCAAGGADFQVRRRNGVDLGNKELAAYRMAASLEDCEGFCERNCSCWGTVYNNASGFCYWLDYPIQTLVEADERKAGYFKVRQVSSGGGDGGAGRRAAVALLAVGCVLCAGAALIGAYNVWWRRRVRANMDESMVEGLAPGPYKDLNSASFRSIELSDSLSFKK